MTLNQLAVFIEVVEFKSFSKAAEELYITQPGVSHSISNLESELGIKLIFRGKDGIYPTETGIKVLKYARTVTTSIEQIRQEVAASLGLKTGKLKIGSFGSVSTNFLPGIMYLFKLRYPKIDLKVFEGTEGEIRDWILSRTIDIGFITFPCNSLETIPVISDDMMVVLPKAHDLAAQKSIGIEELAKYPMLVTWNSSCQILVEEVFKSSTGKTPQWKYKVSNIGTLLAMIKEGLGIAVIPKLALSRDIPNIKILPLKPVFKRRIGLASIIPFTDIAPVTSAFVELTQKWIKDNLDL
ncbi:MAG TPA: LysR family transcriptional regulator [bacterium]|nr:LysR family transcriptional regulator [bacterium]